jgi:hypothetical protein
VLRFLQVFSFKTHARETLPGHYIRRSAIVHQDSSHIVTEVVLCVLTNVCSYDEWVIVRVVLQPNVSGRESYWDVGPGQMKIFPRVDMRYASVIFLPLTLRRVHRLIGAARDCIDDVDHTHHSRAARIRCLLLWWRWW